MMLSMDWDHFAHLGKKEPYTSFLATLEGLISVILYIIVHKFPNIYNELLFSMHFMFLFYFIQKK